MNPLVSCLCVSRLRPQLARALQCFRRQSYTDIELIVVHESPADPRRELIQGLNVREVLVDGAHKLTLGELRNVAIAASRGEFLCQWDDDDWHHPDRIRVQLNHCHTQLRRACTLERWTVFDETTQRAYVSRPRGWEGSLLWHRSLTGIGYPALARGEDIPFVHRIRPLMIDRPDLYVYCYHGSNTWDSSHFQAIFNQSTPLDALASAAVANLIRHRPAEVSSP